MSSKAVDKMIRSIDHTYIIEPLCKAVTHGNSRNKGPLISKICEILPSLYDTKPTSVGRYILPMAVRLVSEKHRDTQIANKKLVRALTKTIDKESLMKLASGSLSREDQAKLMKTLS